MSLSLLALAGLVVYAAGCIAYVYRWRGRLRYASFTQYLRKSRPVFAPLNCLMYMATKPWARRPVLDAGYLQNIDVLRAHWQVIRDEALALHASGAFEAAKAPGSAGYYDVGFRTFFKRGWSKFYLTWYGTDHPSAQRLCPRTVALLKQVPGIRSAMFSILPPGAELSLHSDPMACCLRYHLGLQTPNSGLCHINVDGERCAWRDGEDFVFDETYPHRAHNGSLQPRLILMCDVDRPMGVVGGLLRNAYAVLAKATLVPNTDDDSRGLFSALFLRLAPLREKSLRLRETRRRTYQALKLLLNSTLLGALLALLFGLLRAVEFALA
ncbi:aspartyl/asparaginyl beta-hydroxylase domain-containing protein [Roseateles sp. LKC17W]|uniref:Aspartyl/asparaginyl beta-hydroxylase domain-containing protein n=1 Tax=Pelomonas margarita TaxID=3299031 RepID=A0ABW7FI85_9BURK